MVVMRICPSDVTRVGALVLALALSAAAPRAAVAQDVRDVLSKEVSVGRDGAVLRLEIADGGSLEVALAAGRVVIDQAEVGRYEEGGALEVAWRTLLGTAVALENGPLADALVAWTPPEGLDAEAARVAEAIERMLDEALSAPAAAPVPAPAPAPASPAASADLRALTTLLGRTERLTGLAQALEDLDLDELRLVVDDDLVIGPGEEIEATVVVVDGDLELEGVIRGDVVVVGGDAILREGGRIEGELRYADGRVLDRGGEVARGIVEIEPTEALLEREIRDRIREEVRTATRVESRPSRGRSSWAPLRQVGEGIAGALGNLFTIVVLGIGGGVVLYFAGPNLDAVAETARRTPGRAAMVGTAGAFLVLPAFILGIIALAISIIGLPALILWVPLFPVAVIAAGALGYIAVARNLGSWLARQEHPFLDWVRVTNPYSLIFGGLLVLIVPFIAGNLISIVPFLGALEAVLVVAGVMATVFAILVGFGAVLLTRGGRRPEFWGEDMFTASTPPAGWEDLDPSPGPDPTPPPPAEPTPPPDPRPPSDPARPTGGTGAPGSGPTGARGTGAGPESGAGGVDDEDDRRRDPLG
jgi:hypothetical protein